MIRSALPALGALAFAGASLAQNPDDGPRRPLPDDLRRPAAAQGQDELLAHPGGVAPAAGLASLRTPIHSAAADLGNEYGIWAAGDTYKVSFGGGMTFVPYLGKGYPRNQPLAWRTTSARVGAFELVEPSAGGEPSMRTTDYRCEYSLGGITEAYDVLANGLEQTFVVNGRPPANGDLVIRGAVTSLLRAKNAAPAHQPIVFADADGHAIVEYGRAFAIDANGDKVDVLTGHADGEITLTVPGRWLASAAFPIVVDPLLARAQVATWGAATFGEPQSVDVGRDDFAVTMNIMITYTRAASATDSDMWGRLMNEDYTGSLIAFSDITTSWDTDTARCAFVGGTANRWALVFRRFFPGTTPLSQIRCHVRASGDTVASTAFGFLTPPTSNNDWRPDVGGIEAFAASGSTALVVFQREDNTSVTGVFTNTSVSQVYGSLLDVTTAAGTFGAPFVIQSGTTIDHERPSVNQVAEGGTAFSWMAVCQAFNNSLAGDDWDLIGRKVSNTGTLASGSFISDLALLTPPIHQLGPVVEGQNGRYAVAFSTVDVATVATTGTIAGTELRIERFDWAHADTTPAASGNKPPVTLRANPTRIWEATGLAYDTNDDSHFVVGFRAVAPGTPVAYALRTGFNGQVTEISNVLYFVSGQTPTEVGCMFSNDTNQVHLAYGVDDNTTTLPIFGQTMTYIAPAPMTVFGPSCSLATIQWTGNRQIGAEFNGPQITGAPVGSAHFMVVSLGTTDVPVLDPAVFPGCRLFVQAAGPLFVGTMDLAVGSNVGWRLPLPEFVPSTTAYFQDWYLDPAANRVFSTDRLTVPLIK